MIQDATKPPRMVNRTPYGVNERWKATGLPMAFMGFQAATPGGSVVVRPVVVLKGNGEDGVAREVELLFLGPSGVPGLAIPLGLDGVRGLAEWLNEVADHMKPVQAKPLIKEA